jgi:preprotein translocase subunit SecY
MAGGETSHLPLKINTAGVIPPIFASSLLLLPATLAGFSGGEAASEVPFLDTLIALLGHGQPLYMVFYAAGIIFFAFFYTSIMFNPDDTADNLRKYGGFVPGIRPGKRTAEYLEKVLNRLTVIGSLYLAAVCLLPEFLIASYNLPFYLGGTSLLIVVTVTMDTVTQVQSHLMAHQYEGLVKKSRLGGRRR